MSGYVDCGIDLCRLRVLIIVKVGSAYALSSTAIMPLSGSLSDAFGRCAFLPTALYALLHVSFHHHRKPVMLVSIALFALGSALAGAAQDMVRARLGVF